MCVCVSVCVVYPPLINGKKMHMGFKVTDEKPLASYLGCTSKGADDPFGAGGGSYVFIGSTSSPYLWERLLYTKKSNHVWLVVSNIFPIIYGIILPIDFHIFQDG